MSFLAICFGQLNLFFFFFFLNGNSRAGKNQYCTSVTSVYSIWMNKQNLMGCEQYTPPSTFQPQAIPPSLTQSSAPRESNQSATNYMNHLSQSEEVRGEPHFRRDTLNAFLELSAVSLQHTCSLCGWQQL